LLEAAPYVTATVNYDLGNKVVIGTTTAPITDFKHRSFSNLYKPYINSLGDKAAAHNCLDTYCDACGDTSFVYEIEFSEPVFVHAFLLVFDSKNTDPNVIRVLDIYIGDNQDYTQNTLCGTYGS